jgi:hypothetical protein
MSAKERASIGVLLACARDGGMNNNNMNVYARNADGARMVVCGAGKWAAGQRVVDKCEGRQTRCDY